MIWCDNQAGLAYLKGRDHFSGDGWPDVGETVRLGYEYDAGVTYARNVRRMETVEKPIMRREVHAAAARSA